MGDKVLSISLAGVAREVFARLPSKADQLRLVQGIGAATLAYWKRQAQQHLKSSSRDYIQGLTMEVKGTTVEIALNGSLPNLIENGFAGGDMRKWMLNGPKAKRGKRGRYLIIPFQHGSPGTTGRNVGPQMPGSIHEAARQLKGTLSRPTAAGTPTVRYGERLSEFSRGVNAHAHQLLTTKKKPWHASSIYQGIVRNEKTFKKTTQTTGYTSFRVISENVIRGEKDAEGAALQHWFHPGITASRFAERAQQQVRKIMIASLSQSTQDPPGGKKRGT